MTIDSIEIMIKISFRLNRFVQLCNRRSTRKILINTGLRPGSIEIVIYVYIYKLLVTLVEGDPTAHFSIATTLRCRGGRYSIPRIAPLYP